MLKKKWFKYGFIPISIIVLIFIVPIIINECYKLDIGYITVWDAADVLNYYGIILGVIASVFLLAITIAYNRKQFIYEKALQQQQEKWSDIERVVNQVLDDIHPFKFQKILSDAVESGRADLMLINLNLYESSAKVSFDKILYSINEQEEKYLNDLIIKISTTMQELKEIKNEYIRFYIEAMAGNHAFQQVQASENPMEVKWICAKGIMSDLQEHSDEINKRLSNIYKTKYQPLITQKKEIFKQINEQLILQSEKMLHF